MKLLRFQAVNFGSYDSVEFDLANQGLTLIHGATGSGKSTLQDIPCWVLFGVTAKDGAADEVKSWGADSPTRASVFCELSNKTIEVTRIRGKASQNDLYWAEEGVTHRGKDIVETQKLLNQRLGFNSDLYATAAYFSEFAPTASFFLAKAKERREILERIANLEMPVLLGEKAAQARKEAKREAQDVEAALKYQQGRLQMAEKALDDVTSDASRWTTAQVDKIALAEANSKNFEKIKASKVAALTTKLQAFEDRVASDIQDLLAKINGAKIKPASFFNDEIKQALSSAACKTCGSVSKESQSYVTKMTKELNDNLRLQEKVDSWKEKVAELQNSENPFTPQLETAKAEQNQYDAEAKRLLAEENPFASRREKLRTDLTGIKGLLAELHEKAKKAEHRVLSLTQVYNLSMELRGVLLQQSVKQIQDKTNEALTRYFDSEFRVDFSLPDSDKLEVVIHKGGYECSYTQLSKGQRALLKLCFMTSVMELASNRAGVHFDTLFLDEALDGLDTNLKVKAFELFSAMEKGHSSIFLIEHSTEFKTLFQNQYEVTLEGEYSRVSEG